MRKTDILKEKNGALIFGAGGTAEEFFQDVERRNGEKMKTILLTCEILSKMDPQFRANIAVRFKLFDIFEINTEHNENLIGDSNLPVIFPWLKFPS